MTIKRNSIAVAVPIVVGAILSNSRVLYAQEAPAAPAGATDVLEEVIVKAERRSTDLQATPVAVSVRTGSDLQEQGRFQINQILEDVPSVAFGAPPTPATNGLDNPANLIAIRGIQSNGQIAGSGASVVPAVAEYVDGVVNGTGGDYDLSRAEVLRGPQGTLYGRSATAGVVNIYTASPVLGQLGGNASVEGGNYGLRHYTGAINLPAGEVFAVRVAGNYYEREGFDASIGGRIDTTEGRIKLLYSPSTDFSVLVGVSMQDNQERNGQTQGNIYGTGSGDVAFSQVLYNGQVQIGSGYDQNRVYWAELNWNLGPATLTYLPSFRTFTEHTLGYTDNIGTFVTTALQIPHDYFSTQELRLTSNSTSPLQWQTGAFYYHNNMSLNATSSLISLPFAPPPGTLLDSQEPMNRTTEQVGVFAESTYTLPTKTRLTAGIRGDYTSIDVDEIYCSGLSGTTLCLPLTSEEGKRIWHNFTYKLRAEQDITASNLVYASVASAFLPGDVAVTTGTSGAPAASPYSPETLTSLEIGSKNRFFNQRLQVNGDVFYYWYGGHQVSVQIGAGAGGVPLYANMGANARMTGLELETTYLLTGSDRLGVTLSYIDGWYGSKPTLFAEGVANSHLSGIPPWSINPSYSHTFDLPAGQSLTLLAGALFRSGYLVTDLTQDYYATGVEPYWRNGSTVTENLTLTWNLGSKYSVSAYVRNIADERYKNSITPNTTTPRFSPATLYDPRTAGVVLSARF